MKQIKSIILGVMLMPVFGMAAEQWKVFETSFKSTKTCENPFMDVQVDVVFEKDRTQWKQPAFWDGGKTWEVRFAAPEKGTYTYRAVATDTSNKGLNTKEKTLTVTEYTGDNPHYLPRHSATPSSAIRIGDWKFIQYYEDGRRELYNLKDDIGESDNLAKRMPEQAAKMKAQLDAALKEHGAKIPPPTPAHKSQEGKDEKIIDVKHHYADLGDVRLHYVTAGAGEPLVLLHGWPQTWYEWREIIPLLADRYEIIAPDLRGLGDSSRPETGYNKCTVADDIWRLMSDHLGHERWKLVGHDWGSPVAYALAATHPEAVRQLVLIEGALPISGGPGDKAGINMHELHWSGLGWHMTFHLDPELPEALVQGREEIYLSWFYHNLGHPSYEITKDALEEYVRAYTQPGALRAGFNYYRTWPQDVAELTELMRDKKLSMPLLTVHGSHPFRRRPDLKWLKDPNADRLRTVATNVSEVLIERSGHWIPEEQPQVLAKHLIEFFDRTDSAERACHAK